MEQGRSKELAFCWFRRAKHTAILVNPQCLSRQQNKHRKDELTVYDNIYTKHSTLGNVHGLEFHQKCLSLLIIFMEILLG